MTYTGNCHLGDFFSSRRERGRLGLPTLSVTLNDGLVNREDLDRKQDTNLAPQEHLLVKPGDIAYNMMRMWQGAFGLADREGLVSPAYVVLQPKKGIDSLYASYLFNTRRMVYLFWAYSYGITNDRLRLYFADFERVPVTVPTIPEQQKIAAVLSTWDLAISTARNLLTAESAIFDLLLKSLTCGVKRLPGYNGAWRDVTLSEIGSTYSGLTGKSKEHFGQGKPYIPYKNIFANSRVDVEKFDYVQIGQKEVQNTCHVGDIFFTSSSETPDELGTASVLLDDVGELYLNSFCIGYRLHNFSDLLPEFARFMLRGPTFRRSLDQVAQGYTRFNLSRRALLKLRLSLPSLTEQQAIANVLSTAEQGLRTLQKNIDHLEIERLALSQRLIFHPSTSASCSPQSTGG